MSMKEWAEREVELACKHEAPDRKEGEWDYGCACYESALKAYNSLLEDGHSGMSIGFTKTILNRLIDGKPLTPIYDEPDEWNDNPYEHDEGIHYQGKRMSSLFKIVHEDGSITYSDVDRVLCVDISNRHNTYHFGLASELVNRMYPITMPYLPSDRPYKVFMKDRLYDSKNGDFDSIYISHIILPNGTDVHDVNKYFVEAEDGGWKEITEEEWKERFPIEEEEEVYEVESNED